MTWEQARAWELMRPLVYYLKEDLVAPAMANGTVALDFSAGLGDLSGYLVECGAERVVATRPEAAVPLGEGPIEWRGGVAAGNLARVFASDSFDLAVARMVLQFPTWEGDRVDPDTLGAEFATILRPGGRLVLAFHEFVSVEPVPSGEHLPDVEEMLTLSDRPGLAATARYLGLPPREGPFGESGFGLKVPMLITSLQRLGFQIEIADHPEPFTMPLDLGARTEQEVRELGEKVMAVKARYLSAPDQDVYERPGAVRAMLRELSGLFYFGVWPIVRVVARLAA